MNNFTKLTLVEAMNVKVEASDLENSPMDLHTNVHIKQEPVGVAEEEREKEEEVLYADHEVKEEMVIGPVVLQPTDLAQTSYVQNTSDGLNVDTRSFKCDTNTKCYHTIPYHLKYHKVTRTGEKPNQKSTQTGKKQHKCDICHKWFAFKSYIKYHNLMVHSAEKPYKCDQCNKGFPSKYYLNTHLQIHVREKPYKCDYCYKSYASKYNLNTHLMIHTGEKPY
ncbi:zinc finger protein 665-like, partial [Hyposmocoma kahamanoa]|uniref:zinc finger protein 665-like n=1 Tax=Hyposmocoma kahamanoa TaxID=1477025 RepID=UPI000E6D7A6C